MIVKNSLFYPLNLSKNGSLGLGSFLKNILTPDITSWYFGVTKCSNKDLNYCNLHWFKPFLYLKLHKKLFLPPDFGLKIIISEPEMTQISIKIFLRIYSARAKWPIPKTNPKQLAWKLFLSKNVIFCCFSIHFYTKRCNIKRTVFHTCSTRFWGLIFCTQLSIGHLDTGLEYVRVHIFSTLNCSF